VIVGAIGRSQGIAMNRTKFRYKPAPEPAPEFGPLSEIHVSRRAAFQSAEFPPVGFGGCSC
jgi:hypothetical protein